MSQINPGAILVYQCQFSDSLTQTSAAILQSVSQALAALGISVQATSLSSPSLLSNAGAFLSDWSTLPFQCSLTVQTSGSGTAYGSETDVKSIIDNAFYNATGELPSSSSVPSIISNPGGSAGGTGAASNVPYVQTGASIGDTVTDFFNNLDAGSTFALIAAVVIIAVIIALVFSPGSAAAVVHSFR